jgi:hypothetical protein
MNPSTGVLKTDDHARRMMVGPRLDPRDAGVVGQMPIFNRSTSDD